MPGNSSSRNQRNNPYLIEGWAVDFHRSFAGMFWRWRIELALILGFLAAYVRLTITINWLWALITIAAAIAVALAIPYSRHFHARHAWCVISRHRLQRVCYETRMHTRGGRLPLILWIRPTRVGERAYILCRAGVCADDFDAYRAEIGSGCFAREARVIRNPKYSHFVTLDIVRHDPLTASNVITSQIITHAAPHAKEPV
jgi:hypothetical protein